MMTPHIELTVTRSGYVMPRRYDCVVTVGQRTAAEFTEASLDAAWTSCEARLDEVTWPGSLPVLWRSQSAHVWHADVGSDDGREGVRDVEYQLTPAWPYAFEFEVEWEEIDGRRASPWRPSLSYLTWTLKVEGSGLLRMEVARAAGDCFMAQCDLSTPGRTPGAIKTLGAYQASDKFDDLIEWCDEWFYRQWDAGRLVGLSADAEPSVAPTWERVTQVSDQLDYHGDAELLRESWTCVVAW